MAPVAFRSLIYRAMEACASGSSCRLIFFVGRAALSSHRRAGDSLRFSVKRLWLGHNDSGDMFMVCQLSVVSVALRCFGDSCSFSLPRRWQARRNTQR